MSDETARQAESDLQRKCISLVDREVVYCVSNLVYQLAQGYGHKLPGDLGELAEEAFEVSTPIEDYEEAAFQEGIEIRECEDGSGWEYSTKGGRKAAAEWTAGDGETEGDRPNPWEFLSADDKSEAYREACEAERVEADQREIFEHWIVSKWLAGKLQERGERIGEVGGLTVWGRPTTGQAISMDEVIRDITRDLHKEAVA